MRCTIDADGSETIVKVDRAEKMLVILKFLNCKTSAYSLQVLETFVQVFYQIHLELISDANFSV